MTLSGFASGQTEKIGATELINYTWGCVNLTLTDTLPLEKDSIVLVKWETKKGKQIVLDTSFKDIERWTIEFEDNSKDFVIYNLDFGAAGPYDAKTKKRSIVWYPYQNQLLSWKLDENLQLLKIISQNSNEWTYKINRVGKTTILLVKK